MNNRKILINELLIKRIVPFTIISFVLITKKWYTLPIDAPETVFAGFPLPYVCNGWHTSLSLQFFVLNFLVDFLVYFLFWFLVFWGINTYSKHFKLYRGLTYTIWSIASLIVVGAGIAICTGNNVFFVNQPYEYQLIYSEFGVLGGSEDYSKFGKPTK